MPKVHNSKRELFPQVWAQAILDSGEHGSVKRAADKIGMDYGYAKCISREPAIRALRDQTKAAIELQASKITDALVVERAAERLIEKKLLNEEFLDANLKRVIESGDHERRGLADVVSAIKLAYEKEKLLQLRLGSSVAIQNNVTTTPEIPYVSQTLTKLRAQQAPELPAAPDEAEAE